MSRATVDRSALLRQHRLCVEMPLRSDFLLGVWQRTALGALARARPVALARSFPFAGGLAHQPSAAFFGAEGSRKNLRLDRPRQHLTVTDRKSRWRKRYRTAYSSLEGMGSPPIRARHQYAIALVRERSGQISEDSFPATLYYAFKQSEIGKEGSDLARLGDVSCKGWSMPGSWSTARGPCGPNLPGT